MLCLVPGGQAARQVFSVARRARLKLHAGCHGTQPVLTFSPVFIGATLTYYERMISTCQGAWCLALCILKHHGKGRQAVPGDTPAAPLQLARAAGVCRLLIVDDVTVALLAKEPASPFL